ncbi:MAG: site-specific integrase [Candidatus Bathyarchaeia archaeon]|jgi:site-specific recombinase XerD
MGSASTKRIGIYQYDKIFEAAIRRLQSTSDVKDADKNNITKMVEHLLAKGISKQRTVKYVNHLIVFARIAGKPLGQLDKKAMENLISRINGSRYSENTKHDIKVIVKKYFQWLRGCDENEHEYPEEVRWIKASLRIKRLMPEALLTTEELKMLIEATENQRDRAFVLTHYESGCRIGETLSLKIVNVAFDQHGAVLIVDGKTEPRRVRVIAAAPALASWLNMHPQRNDPNAPLWTGVGTVGRHQPLNYEGARGLLRRLARKTGLKKRVYSHLMRHTRATELANILTEAQMKEHLGWVQGSDMPSVYVHLSGRDVDSALLKAHGITVTQEDKPKMQLTSTTCPRCKQKAGPETQFCPSCGMILDVKAAIKVEEERAKADQIMNVLMKDEEVRKLLAKKMDELYASFQHPHKS